MPALVRRADKWLGYGISDRAPPIAQCDLDLVEAMVEKYRPLVGADDPMLRWKDCLQTYSRADLPLDEDLFWENDRPPAIHDLDSLYANDRLWQLAELAVSRTYWSKTDPISSEAAAHHLLNNASAGYYPNVYGPTLNWAFSSLSSVKKNSPGAIDWALVQSNWLLSQAKRCQTASQIFGLIRSRQFEFANRVLCRLAVGDYGEAKTRAVFDVAFPANVVLTMTSAPHYEYIDRGNHFLMSRADPWAHHHEYSRQLFMEHGSVIWFDISKMDKRIHRTVVRRYAELESTNICLPGLTPSISAAVTEGLLMHTPTVIPDGSVLDRTFRYVPSGAYKIQALETWITSMAVVHADIRLKSEMPLGTPTVEACGVLADDGLLSLDSDRVNEYANHLHRSLHDVGLALKDDKVFKGDYKNFVVLGLDKVGNTIGLDTLKLLYSWLRPERYAKGDWLENQAIRAAGYSQVNRGRNLILHRILEAACDRYGVSAWPQKSVDDIPDLRHFPLPLRLWSERDDIDLISPLPPPSGAQADRPVSGRSPTALARFSLSLAAPAIFQCAIILLTKLHFPALSIHSITTKLFWWLLQYILAAFLGEHRLQRTFCGGVSNLPLFASTFQGVLSILYRELHQSWSFWVRDFSPPAR